MLQTGWIVERKLFESDCGTVEAGEERMVYTKGGKREEVCKQDELVLLFHSKELLYGNPRVANRFLWNSSKRT